MSNLQLVTTEKFGSIDCNFYRNMNNDILLTREQIGTALEYANSQKAIDNIHNKHKDRLDKYSTTLRTRGKTGQEYPTMFYNTKGVMEICRWSRQAKADAFMDFTWDVMDRLIHNNFNTNTIDYSPITYEISSLRNEMQSIKYIVTRQQPVRKYSKWKKKTTPKIKSLADYFNETQMTILNNLYIELEDLYDIDLNEYKSDYCFNMNLDNCSQFDVIENNKQLREMFDSLINSLLDKYGLQQENNELCKRHTLFD